MSTANELVAQIKLATDYQVNKRLLKEKILTDLHIAHNGGMFKITPELIAFLNSWEDSEIFLADIYENPIKINRLEFLTLCKEQYHSVMNQWHIQHEEIKRIRKI